MLGPRGLDHEGFTAVGRRNLRDNCKFCVRTEPAAAAAVGAEHEESTRVLGLRRGVFEVEVNSPVLLQELASYQKRKLLAKLRQGLPNHTLTDLRFKAGTW